MTSEEESVRRVLITEFESIVEIGVRDLLVAGGCEVIGPHSSLNRSLISELRPDAVVVDMDDLETSAVAEGLIPEFPGIPLVECSSSTLRMRVFPAYRFGKSVDLPMSADLLIQAVTYP